MTSTIENLEGRVLLSGYAITSIPLTADIGSHPFAGLSADAGGDLFGAAKDSVFEIAHGTATIQPIASFIGYSGGGATTVTVGADGNVYGTTSDNTNMYASCIFEIPRGAHTLQTLVSFESTGNHTSGPLTLDASGNIYGTTDISAFEIEHDTRTFQTLLEFGTETALTGPTGGLTMDSDGNLYGATVFGGTYGWGGVFEIAHGSNAVRTITSFEYPDRFPGAVTVDAIGDVFGTTFYGGANGYGMVFEIAAGSSTIRPLASFPAAVTTNRHYSRLTLDNQGNIYGTSSWGTINEFGSVFELRNGGNSIRTLFSFSFADANSPYGGVIRDGAGNLYGTTSLGGPEDLGTVFKLSPPVPGDVNGDRKVDLADFLILSRHFGQDGNSDQGDLNDDGKINLTDLLVLVRNFGRNEPAVWTTPSPAPPASRLVPSSNPLAARRRTVVPQNERHQRPDAADDRLPGALQRVI